VPILIGGEGVRVLHRVVEYGDGCIPNWESGTIERVVELNRLSNEAGRGHLPTTAYSVPHERDIVRARIGSGVERIVFNIPSNDRTETLAALNRLGPIMT